MGRRSRSHYSSLVPRPFEEPGDEAITISEGADQREPGNFIEDVDGLE